MIVEGLTDLETVSAWVTTYEQARAQKKEVVDRLLTLADEVRGCPAMERVNLSKFAHVSEPDIFLRIVSVQAASKEQTGMILGFTTQDILVLCYTTWQDDNRTQVFRVIYDIVDEVYPPTTVLWCFRRLNNLLTTP